MKKLSFICMIMLIFALPLKAVQPDEILQDPVLEERARQISSQLRCLVCQNESIDESDARLARDLRLLVRERLLDGASDSETFDYITTRYGDQVLLKPRITGANLWLWLAPVFLFLAAIIGYLTWIKRSSERVSIANSEPLTVEEKARLLEIGTNDRS